MVVAVSEDRQFNETCVATICAELLRENGVGNVAVLGLVPTVSDTNPVIPGRVQVVVKIAADTLYREGIHRSAVEWPGKGLDPDASNHSDLMTAQQTENTVKEADRVLAFPFGSACCIPAKIRTLDLGKDAVQSSVGRVGQPGEEIELQLQEFVGKVGKSPIIDKQAANDEDGLVVLPGWTA